MRLNVACYRHYIAILTCYTLVTVTLVTVIFLQSQEGIDAKAKTNTADSKTVPDKPNIVLLVADDMGWGDLCSYGHPTQECGEIDKMAAEGMRFLQWYSADSLCSPSRAALLTGEGENVAAGRLPVRVGIWGGERLFLTTSTGGLPKNETTIAEALKEAGYTTGMVGKWHLGINEFSPDDGSHLPHHHGFDFVGTNIPWTNHWACDESKRISAECRRGPARGGRYGDGLREMDWAVGEVLKTLVSLQIQHRTLVIFLSDHGGHLEICTEGGSNGILKGGKASTWDGGLRVPGIAWWPGVVAPGQVSHDLVSSMDVFQTAVELAGVTPPDNRIYDGKSLVPMLLQTSAAPTSKSTPSPRTLFHYCSDRLMAVRHGEYKAHFYSMELPVVDYTQACPSGVPTEDYYTSFDCYDTETVTHHNPPLLFNIDTDPGELYPLPINEHTGTLFEILLEKLKHEINMVPESRSVKSSLRRYNLAAIRHLGSNPSLRGKNSLGQQIVPLGRILLASLTEKHNADAQQDCEGGYAPPGLMNSADLTGENSARLRSCVMSPGPSDTYSAHTLP
ncbi:hypothetical protein Bbelb_385850 [Branchiostoma belcheri]|nr:hypothetical protein Bbelb_385850 [Branchiostoma belcheri]